MGTQCGCCNNEERNSDFIINKKNPQVSPVNIATNKNNSTFYLGGIKTKSKYMKEIDSMEPVLHSDFEIPQNSNMNSVNLDKSNTSFDSK